MLTGTLGSTPLTPGRLCMHAVHRSRVGRRISSEDEGGRSCVAPRSWRWMRRGCISRPARRRRCSSLSVARLLSCTCRAYCTCTDSLCSLLNRHRFGVRSAKLERVCCRAEQPLARCSYDVDIDAGASLLDTSAESAMAGASSSEREPRQTQSECSEPRVVDGRGGVRQVHTQVGSPTNSIR